MSEFSPVIFISLLSAVIFSRLLQPYTAPVLNSLMFAGSTSSFSFPQVPNATPPRLRKCLGKIICSTFSQPYRAPTKPSLVYSFQSMEVILSEKRISFNEVIFQKALPSMRVTEDFIDRLCRLWFPAKAMSPTVSTPSGMQ